MSKATVISTSDFQPGSDSDSEPGSGSPTLSWRELKDPAVLLSCGFGSGFIRPAPGTWGSVLGLAVWWLVLQPQALHWQMLAIVSVFVAGTATTARVIQKYGVNDPGAVVVDEVVGVWIALLLIPNFSVTPLLLLAAFGLFRLFDIWKPWPVRWADREVPGAFGVMLDDVLAGGLACLVMQATIYSFL